jgi:hypothetical protein
LSPTSNFAIRASSALATVRRDDRSDGDRNARAADAHRARTDAQLDPAQPRLYSIKPSVTVAGSTPTPPAALLA